MSGAVPGTVRGAGSVAARLRGIDAAAEIDRIAGWMRQTLRRDLGRRGLVVAISGGVDSGVCAALAVAAVGPARVHGLLLPERDSASQSAERGAQVARMLGIDYETVTISGTLEAIGCYRDRDAAIRRALPDYDGSWPHKIVLANPMETAIPLFKIVAERPDGTRVEARLDRDAYLGVVAATNFKQRIRKTIEYHHADKRHYAVVGTPNLLEYALGFFVKNGDGAADLKPIAHLYKTEVYALARALDLPEAVATAVPSTDTYSLPQGQDEFYFTLPYDRMDVALWCAEQDAPEETLMAELGLERAQAGIVLRDIAMKRRAAAYLHAAPHVLARAG